MRCITLNQKHTLSRYPTPSRRQTPSLPWLPPLTPSPCLPLYPSGLTIRYTTTLESSPPTKHTLNQVWAISTHAQTRRVNKVNKPNNQPTPTLGRLPSHRSHAFARHLRVPDATHSRRHGLVHLALPFLSSPPLPPHPLQPYLALLDRCILNRPWLCCPSPFTPPSRNIRAGQCFDVFECQVPSLSREP